MNSYKHLDVFMENRKVGTLALTPERSVAFAYDDEWLSDGFSLNPFSLPLQKKVFVPKYDPFDGLFGAFADSLPDGWGRLLVDRLLLHKGINPKTVDASIGGEHATCVNGNGQNPGMKDIMAVADHIKLNHSKALDIAEGIQNTVHHELGALLK